MPSNRIIEDIFEHRLSFLPGDPCEPDDVLSHFADSILIDGLTREESELVLSALPRNSKRIYLNPLDKGLSEAKVYAGRYETDGTLSKPYVFKIGPLTKIEREYEAMERRVCPHISCVERPIPRRATEKGMIIQPLAGLNPRSQLKSLKDYARTSNPEIVTRLLAERLAPWYDRVRDESPGTRKPLGILFEWYLTKVQQPDTFPADWSELKEWVRQLTGHAWCDVPQVMKSLAEHELTFKPAIIHGDLHSQNVLVDEKEECWPIDFYWCNADSTPLMDFAMLECSLKFLAIHHRSDLRSIIEVENILAREPIPTITLQNLPYRSEIGNALRSVIAVRKHALDTLAYRFDDYRKVLSLMTYVHSTHPLLNRPFVLASLQILSALQL